MCILYSWSAATAPKALLGIFVACLIRMPFQGAGVQVCGLLQCKVDGHLLVLLLVLLLDFF